MLSANERKAQTTISAEIIMDEAADVTCDQITLSRIKSIFQFMSPILLPCQKKNARDISFTNTPIDDVVKEDKSILH